MNRSGLAALRRLMKPIRGRMFCACLMQAAATACGAAPFIAVAEALRGLAHGRSNAADALWHMAWLLAGALALRVALSFGAGSLTHFADNDLQLHLRRRMAEALALAELRWFEGRHSGEVKKAVQDDVSAMHHLVAHASLDIIAALALPVVSLAYLARIQPALALLALVPPAASAWLHLRQMRGFAPHMAAYGRGLAAVNAATVELVQGIEVVKTFGRARQAHERLSRATREFLAAFRGWVRSQVRLSAACETLLAPTATLLWLCALGLGFMACGLLARADIIPFLLVGAGLATPLSTLTAATPALQSASDAAVRVERLLATPPMPESVSPQRPEGARVRFEGVRFSFDGARQAVDGVDLTLEPGSVTALVGPSGSGKSTLARLLLRFADPASGRITIGGADLRRISREERAGLVGFVFQEAQLLRASLRDNIRLPRPGASQEDIERAARAARIHEVIAALPRGYDSVAGEDAPLSGGEAQRVAIARAILADAPILVLDEATSHADPACEAAIQKAVSTLAQGRTLLVIAHRLETIAGAHNIVVLEQGRVCESGTHAELLECGGTYARMWDAARPGARRGGKP